MTTMLCTLTARAPSTCTLAQQASKHLPQARQEEGKKNLMIRQPGPRVPAKEVGDFPEINVNNSYSYRHLGCVNSILQAGSSHARSYSELHD